MHMISPVLRSAKRAPTNVRRLNNRKWRHFLLFSRRTFAGARFAERSTGIVISYPYDRYPYTVPWKDALQIRLLLSDNQSEGSFQSKFRGYTIFTFHFTRRTCFFERQWEIVCEWVHMMPLEPIKHKPNVF